MDKISKYQKKCWSDYKDALGIGKYCYGYGNPVKVHVPVDTSTGSIMIVGAYPTAHFNTINSITNVPVSDHLYPFSDESYFDGSSVRKVKSGEEISEHYLKPISIDRSDCWITDLVKVFLFKPGHIRKYETLGFELPLVFRNDFMKYAKLSQTFLYEELSLAKPKLVFLLGSEVIQAVLNVTDNKAKQLLQLKPITKTINGREYTFFAMPHPGIIMVNSKTGKVYKKILENQLNYIKTQYSDSI